MADMIPVIVVFGIYYLAILVLLAGWRRALHFDFPEYREHLRITVIIPFRNEEKNITPVIRNLIVQRYNPAFVEVLLCDDHSTDAGVQYAASAISGLSNFFIVRNSGTGKKDAITCCVAQASGQVIVTTDADCLLPENWLARINHAFQAPAVQMVFGGVAMRPTNGFFARLQSLEFVSLVGSAAAAAGLGRPILCNGANLAFRTDAFRHVKGYQGNESIPSGDDEFLLRKIETLWPGSIRFLNTEDSVVATQPQVTLTEFINQRIRWAGKWRYNTSRAAKWTAVLVVFFQLFFLGCILAMVFDFSLLGTMGPMLGAKVLLEFIFLFQCAGFLEVRCRVPEFLVLQFLYPLYVIFVGIASHLRGYEWKERAWNHRGGRSS